MICNPVNAHSLPSDALTRPGSAGVVVSVKGSQARVGLRAPSDQGRHELDITVGQFLAVQSGTRLLIGMVCDVQLEPLGTSGGHHFFAAATLDLMGEIIDAGTTGARFQRGVSKYPSIGNPVHVIDATELRTIYAPSGRQAIQIGQLQQDPTVLAHVDVDDMIGKHFALLGSTGVGKSSGVALILHEILRVKPEQRILLIDAHNEYGRCFGDAALVLNPRNLKLPFWLFSFEEILDVFFGARTGTEEETATLGEIIPIAKYNYSHLHHGESALKKSDPKTSGITVDTPVPYRMADLLRLIDDRMGKLENRSLRLILHKLMARIEAVMADARYGFMFENANVGGDTMAEVISQVFRLPAAGKPMTVLQLAGFPPEVVDSLISVLCRMAFEFGMWSDGASSLLIVCEEAHRYATADKKQGFGPTRKALSRIAKEGRKYGVHLGLVTQRPAELDPTLVSQCNTLFAMRLANDRDQALLRSAVSDAAANLVALLPSLGPREVLAFGEGVALPTRLRFRELSAQELPRGETATAGPLAMHARKDFDFVAAVLERWRSALAKSSISESSPASELRVATLSPRQAPHGLGHTLSHAQSTTDIATDQDRFRSLKKPIGSGPFGGRGPQF